MLLHHKLSFVPWAQRSGESSSGKVGCLKRAVPKPSTLTSSHSFDPTFYTLASTSKYCIPHLWTLASWTSASGLMLPKHSLFLTTRPCRRITDPRYFRRMATILTASSNTKTTHIERTASQPRDPVPTPLSLLPSFRY
jgi:hypothetical protein